MSSETTGTTGAATRGSAATRRLVAKRNRRLSHLALWLLSLVPAALLVVDGFTMRLGINPIETITNRTGWWAMSMLAVTLAITPLRRVFGWHGLVRYRRQLGLATFIYASLHLGTYAFLDLGLDLSHLGEDIIKRPFITVGLVAWLLLLALAITSTNGWIRRLGKRWALLHKAVYVIAGLALLHFFWSQKADRARPLQFLAVFVVLLGVRVVYSWLKRRRAAVQG
ncbi:MAG TPA: protein-methionine-sulfoxide reductase heme-binding subunit MsrQ [Trueperaceae bacterium]|nr:protein-methionine-sulfoxide reductase heme-binding subunit MsrQ [Trueperaceae bacterium]